MKIIETRKFNIDGIRKACIECHLFTRGDNAAYDNMLNLAKHTIPTPKGLYKIASIIADFSDDATADMVMFILANNAVYFTYQIKV